MRISVAEAMCPDGKLYPGAGTVPSTGGGIGRRTSASSAVSAAN